MFDLFLLAGGSITFDRLADFVAAAPTEKVPNTETDWLKIPIFGSVLLKAKSSLKSLEDERVFSRATNYWFKIFTGYPSKMRASGGRDVPALISSETNITPESIMSGKIVVVDLPLKELRHTGLMVQSAWKYLFQTALDGNVLSVSHADTVTLLISAGTSFNGPDKSPGHDGVDPTAIAVKHLRAAQKQSYADLLARHVADYQKLFRRVELNLGENPAAEHLFTDERLVRFAEGQPDPGLATLLYQYGRCLLISSSRPGGLPANLQGIWNDSMRPPWSANWTLNINAEMNYWPSEIANLAECHEPFLDFIQMLSVHGRKTAEVNYGAHGWAAHHNADIWGQTGPAGNYGVTIRCGQTGRWAAPG